MSSDDDRVTSSIRVNLSPDALNDDLKTSIDSAVDVTGGNQSIANLVGRDSVSDHQVQHPGTGVPDGQKHLTIDSSSDEPSPEDRAEDIGNASKTADSRSEVTGPSIAETSDFIEKLLRMMRHRSPRIEFNVLGSSREDLDESSNEFSDDDVDEDADAERVAQSGQVPDCRCTACLNQKLASGKPINYAVEYTDNKGGWIITRNLKKPLNLRAMQRKRNKQATSSIFTVSTVVQSSITEERRLCSPWFLEEWNKSNPLRNPDTSLTFHTIRLTLLSPVLLEALRNVVLYYPDLRLRTDRVSLIAPYAALAHHMDSLRLYRDKLVDSKDQRHSFNAGLTQKQTFPPDHQNTSTACNATAAEHLTQLLDFLKDAYGDRIETEKSRNDRGLCTFAMLWLLFKPGTTVYTREKPADTPSAMVIKSVEVDPAIWFRNDNERTPYQLELWNLDFDGSKLGRRLYTREIEQFHGEQTITSLKIFPCHFLDTEDGGKTRKAVVDRGKRWYSLLKGKKDGHFHGRVYVDCTSYWRNKDDKEILDLTRKVDNDPSGIGGCICSVCANERSSVQQTRLQMWKTYDGIDPSETECLNLEDHNTHTALGIDKEHRYLICTPVLGGLVLKTRAWEKLDAGFCSDVQPKSKAIDSLVMRKPRKDMIKALLHNYSTSTDYPGTPPATWSADFVEHKGDGRIFLLHGPPGVGKTYTAECIAEYTGRPLISLTCGDIGTREEDIEKNLRVWFTLGEKWGAVMLIDEADVYLESRKPGDLKRNGLVSVFLRSVEYYKGILFLTTNRVGQFDDAFISRIHVVLRYKVLSVDDRKQIWEGFFDKLEKERGRQIRITKQARKYVLEDQDMVKIPWNGREIRNAFQTAVALAQYQFAMLEDKEEGEKAELDEKHFEEVCSMTRSFKKYLKKVHRKDEEGVAALARNRNEEEESDEDDD